MSDPFVAEIRIWALNFAPRGWAFCNGQLLPISQNTALFSLLGTTFGGDGRTTFALPDLQGRVPVHPGRGPGLTDRRLGEEGGFGTETLSTMEMPSHTHALSGNSSPGDSPSPADSVSSRTIGATPYRPPTGATMVAMASNALASIGAGAPHNNLMPYLTLNFCIALVGIYPSRS